MKIYPIKLEKLVPPKFKLVEWKLHNVCNYNCSFCGTEHKDGSVRWKDITSYKNYVEKIVRASEKNPLWIILTGGEPTLYPDLLELMKYMKQQGVHICLVSNGSRTLRFWEEVKNAQVLDQLYITYHTEQTKDVEHVKNVLNIFHLDPVKTCCLVTHTINTVDETFDVINFMVENTGALIYSKAMNIYNTDIYSLYTKEQLEKLRKQSLYVGSKYDTKIKTNLPINMQFNSELKLTYSDGTEEQLENAQKLMKEQKNNFYNWDCNIGMDNLRIDYNIVYRGECGVGGILADLDHDDLIFAKNSVKCPNQTCVCAINLGTKKVFESKE